MPQAAAISPFAILPHLPNPKDGSKILWGGGGGGGGVVVSLESVDLSPSWGSGHVLDQKICEHADCGGG